MKFSNLLFVVLNLLSILWTNIRKVEGILGGNIVHTEDYKYMVSIQVNNKHVCGGGILRESYVLSAAHCFIDQDDKFKKNRYTVVSGVIHLLFNIPPGITSGVKVIYVPEEFKGTNPEDENLFFSQSGDIAVLQLKDPLPLLSNDLLQPLRLPKKIYGRYSMYYKKKAIITGFGIDYSPNLIARNDQYQREFTYEMKFAETTALHKTLCKNYFYQHLTDKHLCSQVTQYQSSIPEGTCYGDDGGPLVYQGDTVIGVLMKGDRECNEKNVPSLYTRVSSFITFINNAMQYNRQQNIRVAVFAKINRINQTTGVLEKEEELIELNPRLV